MTENKNSFFFLTLTIPEEKNNEIYLDKINDFSDLVFSSMGVTNTIYKFQNITTNQILYFFKTENRKRRGQLIRFCEKLLPKDQEYNAGGLTRFSFYSEIKKITNNKYFKLMDLPSNHYDGEDIRMFNDPKKWYPWQKEIYNKIWNPDGTFKKPDPRHIISIVDIKGNSGKSSFFKWLFYHNRDTIGRIGYGSASQLRSCIINIGKKDLYIIDLSRAKSKSDREEDLLSVLEDLKSGLVTNAMYGSGKSLLIPPPHIIVSSNYFMKYELLSADRWETYRINRRKELKETKIKPTHTTLGFLKK